MKIKDFFVPNESIVALDIGSGNIKMLELDTTAKTPRVEKLSIVSFKEEIFSNYAIVKPEVVAEAVKSLFETNEIKDQRVAIAVPGPAALIKKIRVEKASYARIREQLEEEASSIMPTDISHLSYDYHILSEPEPGIYEILVVAVRNEVVESYINPFRQIGVEVAVVDIDYYALNNCFEMSNVSYAEDELYVVVDIGAKYTKIVIKSGNEILHVGDISIGGKVISDRMMEEFDIDFNTAEDYKYNSELIEESRLRANVEEFIEEQAMELADDFNRQLNIFLSSLPGISAISKLYLTGGGSLAHSFKETLSKKTGYETSLFDSFAGINLELDIDDESVQRLSPLFTVAVGLAVRKAADRTLPEKNV